MTFFTLAFLGVALTLGLVSVFHPEQPTIVVVSCANEGSPPCCGNHLKFDATVGNVDPGDKLSYRWSLTKGAILSGQGTTSIEVDASDAEEQPIMVTLEVHVRERKRKRQGIVSASYQTCTFPRRPTSFTSNLFPLSFRADRAL
ncbi:MAG TPA: hypothetical protein VMZ30_04025 [Pyrinomonadaceae bacterium]|nr:hypothetical protein [Pyrinomonadaceae bacterium]